MSRLVMDTLFLEHLSFRMLSDHFQHCAVAPSREEVLRRCLASKGLELIEYGSWVFAPHPQLPEVTIMVFSRAYRERTERETASR